MGIGCGKGNKIKINYDCIGKGKLEISTFQGSALDRSLNIYVREKYINKGDINAVCYNYDPIDTKKSAKQLGIPEGAVLTIKLKSDFNK